MVSSFNLAKLDSLLKDFYTLTQIRITVFDENFQELTAYPPTLSDFCQLIRTNKEARSNCRNCDKRACEIASQQRSAHTYHCHAGLTESIVPLYLGNILVGYLFFGQVFSYPSYEEGWDTIRKLCTKYNLDLSALKNACTAKPIISKDYIQSASQILEAVASYVCLEHMAILKHKTLAIQIDEYISEHYTEDIKVSTLCLRFQIGKTRLYEIAKQSYGIGLAEHIRNLRIEKAKSLLTSRLDLNISDIAFLCGFSDYNYFITVFKRITGISPKTYRLNNNN